MVDAIEGLDEASSPDRLYPILTDQYHDFYAGHTADGRQILVGEWCPDIVIGTWFKPG